MAEEPLALNSVRFRRTPVPLEMRLLYRGFSAAEGDDIVIIPTVLYNKWGRTTVFSIQNLEAESIDVTIHFFDADDGGALASEVEHTILARSSRQIEMDNWQETGLTYLNEDNEEVARIVFNGTAIMTATKTTGGQPANIVASASEYFVRRPVAADFEGMPAGDAGDTVYMATAVCAKYDLDTWYAITNIGAVETDVAVDFFENDGTPAGSVNIADLGTGHKASLHTCTVTNPDFIGSAVITADEQDAQLVALGKAQQTMMTPTIPTATVNFNTIFQGETAGDSIIAFPFVRYANDEDYFSGDNVGNHQRSFLAVRNMIEEEIKVWAYYYDKDGNECGKEVLTIPENGKENSSALSASAIGDENGEAGDCSGLKDGAFGYYADGTFGGAVILAWHGSTPNAEFIAINRTQHFPEGKSGAGEDVNGIPVP